MKVNRKGVADTSKFSYYENLKNGNHKNLRELIIKDLTKSNKPRCMRDLGCEYNIEPSTLSGIFTPLEVEGKIMVAYRDYSPYSNRPVNYYVLPDNKEEVKQQTIF